MTSSPPAPRMVPHGGGTLAAPCPWVTPRPVRHGRAAARLTPGSIRRHLHGKTAGGGSDHAATGRRDRRVRDRADLGRGRGAGRIAPGAGVLVLLHRPAVP